MNLRAFLAAATVLAAPFIAHAQPVTGPYVDINGGAAIQDPVTYKFPNTGDRERYQYKLGYSVTGGAGYGFGNGFRIEVDGDYLHNTVHKADDRSGLQTVVHGAEKNYGGMVNVFYDFTIPGFPLFPFIGGGLGGQQVGYHNPIGAYNAGTGQNLHVYHKPYSFAYDLIAGVSYPVAALPGLSLTAEYRFMEIPESRNYDASGYRIKIGQEFSHSFLVGLRYQIFNPSPPPPAPTPAPAAPVAAPAPAPAKTYLVFFDWDKSILTPRTLSIIGQAAADSRTGQTTVIDVSGYTDTSGTANYNQGLSERRANAVAAQLVADGVAASEIQTLAFGETHLLVPTGPGVREPQNRRVSIVLK